MFFKIGSPKNFSISTVNTSLWVLKACNFIKKRTQNRSFPVNIAKFLGTAFFIEHLGRLLQTVLSQYSKVSWDVCSLISSSTCFHVDQNLTQNAAQTILFHHTTKQLLLAWIHWSCALDFRLCFGKTLVAFGFDENVTQSVAQTSM